MNRVPEFCEQLGVQIGVGVETTAPVALASPGSIGEAAARLLYEKDPGRVVPDMAALHQEAVDLTAYKFNERKGAFGERVLLWKGDDRGIRRRAHQARRGPDWMWS